MSSYCKRMTAQNSLIEYFHPITVKLFLSFIREALGTTLMKNSKADRTLDCLGLFCPEPVFRIRLELDKMEVGETLEIWADDPAAERDIQSLTKRLGHEIVEMKKEGVKLYFVIKKGR